MVEKVNPKKYSKKELEVEYGRLNRELKEVRSQLSNRDTIKLEEPIRDGWSYLLVIDSKLKLIKKYRSVYEYFDRNQFSLWGKSKKDLRSRMVDHINTYTSYGVKYPFLLISPKNYNRGDLDFKKLCIPHKYKCKDYKGRDETVYCWRLKLPESYIKFRFRKSYITHRYVINPTLESRYSELLNKINGDPRLYKLYSRDYFSKKDLGWEPNLRSTHKVKFNKKVAELLK